MILTEDEKNNIHELIKNYKKSHDQITRAENLIKDFSKSLELLQQEKDVIIERITENRNNEAIVMKQLEEKYGPGKLNPTTLEWIPQIKQE
jgi:hypothetical protein